MSVTPTPTERNPMKTLLCYGDSNTHGTSPLLPDGSWHRYGPETRWPRRLASLLGPDWHVIEEGLPGRTTCHDNPFDGPHKNGLRHLPVALECHAPLDLFAVMLGTNDLKAYFGLTPFDIAKGIRTLLTMVQQRAPGRDGKPPALLVISPVPIDEVGAWGESLAGGAAKSRRLASYLAEVAEEFGALFFDAGSVAQASPVDGVHLSEEAHLAIADGLAKLLRQ